MKIGIPATSTATRVTSLALRDRLRKLMVVGLGRGNSAARRGARRPQSSGRGRAPPGNRRRGRARRARPRRSERRQSPRARGPRGPRRRGGRRCSRRAARPPCAPAARAESSRAATPRSAPRSIAAMARPRKAITPGAIGLAPGSAVQARGPRISTTSAASIASHTPSIRSGRRLFMVEDRAAAQPRRKRRRASNQGGAVAALADEPGGAALAAEALELFRGAIRVEHEGASAPRRPVAQGDLHELVPGEAGHADVDEDQIGILLGQGRAEREGRVDGDDLEAALFEEHARRFEADGAVVHEEDAALPARGAARAGRREGGEVARGVEAPARRERRRIPALEAGLRRGRRRDPALRRLRRGRRRRLAHAERLRRGRRLLG